MSLSSPVFPGCFDPITNGHVDIVRRAVSIFGRLTVAILENPSKQWLIPIAKRIELVEKTLEVNGIVDVEVVSFQGLLVDLLRRLNSKTIIRGIRGGTDFDYELNLSRANHHLHPGVDTCFLMAHKDCSFISSSLVQQIVHFGGDISNLVPATIVDYFVGLS